MWALYIAFVIYKEQNPAIEYRDFQLDVIHALINRGTYKAATKRLATSNYRLDSTVTHIPIMDPSGATNHRQ